MADKGMPKWDVNSIREQTRQMSTLSTSVKKLQQLKLFKNLVVLLKLWQLVLRIPQLVQPNIPKKQ